MPVQQLGSDEVHFVLPLVTGMLPECPVAQQTATDVLGPRQTGAGALETCGAHCGQH